MLKFDRYECEFTFLRDVLATNPADPAVMDTHILARQRKLILEKSGINKELNKYLNAPPISDAKGKAEIQGLVAKLEEIMGEPLSSEQKAMVAAGKLEDLMETFKDFEFRGLTVFFWNEEKERPMVGFHQVSGFLKDAAEFWWRRDNTTRKNATVLHLTDAGKVVGSISHTMTIINQEVKCDDEFLVFDKDIKRHADGAPAYLQRSLRAETAQGPRVSLAKSEVVKAGAKLKFVFKIPAGSQMTEDCLRMLLDAGETIGFGQWRNAQHGCFTYELKKVD